MTPETWSWTHGDFMLSTTGGTRHLKRGSSFRHVDSDERTTHVILPCLHSLNDTDVAFRTRAMLQVGGQCSASLGEPSAQTRRRYEIKTQQKSRLNLDKTNWAARKVADAERYPPSLRPPLHYAKVKTNTVPRCAKTFVAMDRQSPAKRAREMKTQTRKKIFSRHESDKAHVLC